MEVDPAVRFLLPGVSESVSRTTYTEVITGLRAIGQQTTPLCESAGIEGALVARLFPLRGYWEGH